MLVSMYLVLFLGQRSTVAERDQPMRYPERFKRHPHRKGGNRSGVAGADR